MDPQGGIDSIDLKDGKLIWSTKAGSKPLGIVQRQLLAQAEARSDSARLEVVTIDPSTGNAVSKGATDLPPGASASVNSTVRGELFASVQPEKDDAIVSWQFRGRRKQGLPPGTADAFAPKLKDSFPPGASSAATDHGAFRLNLLSGSTSAVDESKFRISTPPGAAAPKEQLEVTADRTLSADGRHIVVTRRTGDERTRNKYTLTVYDVSSGERLGEIKSHMPAISFFVQGSLFVAETKPYTWRTSSGLEEQPLKLRADELKTGEELWSQPIRDTTYRGPVPP
jgi:outer membrane protein assembly factor BamB